MKLNSCVIAGGGVCGLFAAILLADKFKQVTVVERDAVCGGLLKSTKFGDYVFDQGTHVPNTTLIPEIDSILFGNELDRNINWHDLGRLKTANFFQGKWNMDSQMIDIRNLPPEQYEQAVVEILSLTEPSKATDIVSYLNETLGPCLTKNVIAPIALKLYGKNTNLASLATNSSVGYFGLSRVMALTPEITCKLKEIPEFDKKLAYHSEKDFKTRIVQDKSPLRSNYYPKNYKGVGFWVEYLKQQAVNKGVKIINNDYVDRIVFEKKDITSVILAGSETPLPCDYLFWSVPPAQALKAANIPIKQVALKFKSAVICHFCVDRPLLDLQSYYVWNWDVNFKGFRVTLYPNLQPCSQTPQYKVTYEALCDEEMVDEILLDDMYQELIDIGIIEPNSNVLTQNKQVVHNTFPVPTFDFQEAVIRNNELLNSAFDNIQTAGRYAGKSWFHEDVFKQVYFELQQRFSSEKLDG